jgi:hypothetical protein
MLRRLLFGLFKGALIGGVAAAVLIKGLGVAVFGGFLAYTAAVLVGAVTGLFAGKPLWARDARIEVILKAIVGAAVAGAAMFALRKWVPAEIDLSALGAGAVGSLPAVSLPLISTFLAVVFELDNTKEAPATDDKAAVAPPKHRLEAADDELAEVEEDALKEADYGRSRRKH